MAVVGQFVVTSAACSLWCAAATQQKHEAAYAVLQRSQGWQGITGAMDRPTFAAGCRHAHLSRYMAVHLKQLQLTAEAMRRARAGHLRGLPAMHEWQCGYSDTPFTGRCSGAIK